MSDYDTARSDARQVLDTLADLGRTVLPVEVEDTPQGQLLRCAFCEHDRSALHLGAPTWHVVGDGYGSPLGTRGNWLEIPLWCDCCWHRSRFVFAFHKGTVEVGATYDPRGSDDLDGRDTERAARTITHPADTR